MVFGLLRVARCAVVSGHVARCAVVSGHVARCAVVSDPRKKLRFVTGLCLLVFGPWLLIAGPWPLIFAWFLIAPWLAGYQGNATAIIALTNTTANQQANKRLVSAGPHLGNAIMQY